MRWRTVEEPLCAGRCSEEHRLGVEAMRVNTSSGKSCGVVVMAMGYIV